MVTKPKKNVKQTKKIVKKEPTPSSILKKVATVSDSNKLLQKEIKNMTKIFGENQKVLISMKGMIDTLTSTLENIQKQSKQINIIEEDTQKLFAGLNQVRTQSNLVNKINDQTTKLQEEVDKLSKVQKASKASELTQQVEDSINSIKNNSQMIIKIAQRIDEVRDDLRNVSGKTDTVIEISTEIEKLKNNIQEMAVENLKTQRGIQIIESLKNELGRLSEEVSSTSNLSAELNAIKVAIDTISSKASKIDSLEGVIEGLKMQFDTVSSKVETNNDLNFGSIQEITRKIDDMESKIEGLSKGADSAAFVGEELKESQKKFTEFKHNMFDKTNSIEQKIGTISESLKKQDALTSEFHKKTDNLFTEIHELKEITSKTSDNSSNDMMLLLKLSEYQSNIRINSETKYGDVKIIEKMASQTRDIANLFERVSGELDKKIPVPQEVQQWAVSKILDCADKWEIRFSDVFSILSNTIGRESLKELVKIQQIREIYGMRGVDEIRKELNIS